MRASVISDRRAALTVYLNDLCIFVLEVMVVSAIAPDNKSWRKLVEDLSRSFDILRTFVTSLDNKLRDEHAAVKRSDPGVSVVLAIAASPSIADDVIVPLLLKSCEGVLEKTTPQGFITFKDLNALSTFDAAFSQLINLKRQGDFLRRSTLSQIISIVEGHIPRAILLNARAVSLDKSSLSFSELQQCSDLEEARMLLLERRISEELYGGVSRWLDFIKSACSVGASYIEEHRDKLIEVALRRNVFMHADGIVNSAYLANLPDSLRTDAPKRGSQLTLNLDYLLEAIDCYDICFTLLFAEAWDKAGGPADAIADTLEDIAYRALCEERWKKARSLTRFIKGDRRVDRAVALRAEINYWQSFRWANEFGVVEKDVRRFSTSGLEPQFAVAKALLLGERPDVVLDMIDEAIRKNMLPPGALFSWPIFRELRKTTEFLTFIQERGLSEPEKQRLDDILMKRLRERMEADPAAMRELYQDIGRAIGKEPSTQGLPAAVDTVGERENPSAELVKPEKTRIKASPEANKTKGSRPKKQVAVLKRRNRSS